ncbi:MAG: O-antigen ligase family protein [Verrucomicrobia bacterium]|nr:O-antigen ligase family protein [Verrucomicrobiota bacterium]
MTVSILSKLSGWKTEERAGKWCMGLLSLIFILVPFQRRFHGAVDSYSRSLSLPDFPLPEYFSTHVHLYLSDLLVIALTLGIFLLYKVSLRAFFWEGASKYLTLLLLASLASICFSITASYAIPYFRLLQFAVLVLLFHSIRFLSQKIDLILFIKRLAWILVIVCTFECSISIVQYFTQHSLGLGFLGEKSLHHFPFPNPGQNRWFFDQVFNAGQGHGHLFRASGTFSHPNILGGYIFCSAMASCFLFVQQLYKGKKILLTACILLQFFTLSVAFSRSAMIALGLSSLVWCALQFRKKRSNGKEPYEVFKGTRKVMGAVLLSCLLCIGIFYSQLTARGGVINYNEIAQHADSERLQYIKIAIDMLKEHPLLGVGFNNFQLYLQQYQENLTGHIFFSKVHNIYLLIAAETGLIGGGLFLLFLLALVRGGWKGLAKEGGDYQTKILLFSIFIGFLFIGQCDFYLIESPQGSLLFFGIAGLLCGANGQMPLLKAPRPTP